MSWIRQYGGTGAVRVRLICFPHAGGSAGFFHSWREFLPAGVELCAVQYPGRQERLLEPPIDTMTALVSELVPALGRLGRLPTVFLGHSMGASVAFECARRLARAPELLVVSARPGPAVRREPRVVSGTDEELLADVRKLGGPHIAVLDDPLTVELILPSLRADYRLVETYRPDPTVTTRVPVLAAGGDGDPEVSAADIQAWESATTGTFHHRIFPGDHFYLSEHGRELVTAALAPVLDDGPGA
jgi:pyochelin biosynthetic protein PchC